MQALNKYYQTISPIHPLSTKEKKLISQMVREKLFEPKMHLLKAGEISDTIYFISSGLVRSYYNDPLTNEQTTTWFMPDGGFIYSIKSYLSDSPSTENIIAEEPTLTLSIKKADWESLVGQSLKLANVAIKLLEQYLFLCDERLRTHKYPAEDRYREFCKQYKSIESRLKPEHIASYLGISRSTLFSIRKKRIC